MIWVVATTGHLSQVQLHVVVQAASKSTIDWSHVQSCRACKPLPAIAILCWAVHIASVAPVATKAYTWVEDRSSWCVERLLVGMNDLRQQQCVAPMCLSR